MKKTIGEIIWGTHSRLGHCFDYIMIGLILLSLVSMVIESMPGIPNMVRYACGVLELLIILIFTAEYLLRLWTSEKVFKYVFSFWGFVDVIAILPFWLALGSGWEAARTMRILRILRLLKLVRYVAASDRIQIAFELVWRELVIAFFLALLVIIIAAVGIYSFEHDAQPEAFASIPHSLWFAVATLTTVGYGDITPITAGGKAFTFVILMVGIAIVAIPTSLITSALTQARQIHEERAKKTKARTKSAKP